MNKTILTVFLGVFLVGMFALVVAPGQEDVEKDKPVPTLYGANATNMTVGQCVAAAAAVKNTCYGTVKDARSTCRIDAKNQTEPKPALKACTTTFRKDLKQCKLDFKAEKTQCKALKKPKSK